MTLGFDLFLAVAATFYFPEAMPVFNTERDVVRSR